MVIVVGFIIYFYWTDSRFTYFSSVFAKWGEVDFQKEPSKGSTRCDWS